MRFSVVVSRTQDYKFQVSAPAKTPVADLAELAIKRLGSMSRTDLTEFASGAERVQLVASEQMLPSWPEAKIIAGRARGWEIADHVSGLVVIRISRARDESARVGGYKTDAAAMHHVRYQAEQGDELCAEAVAYVEYINSGEA